jgi:hypothetical protein
MGAVYTASQSLCKGSLQFGENFNGKNFNDLLTKKERWLYNITVVKTYAGGLGVQSVKNFGGF